MNDGIPILTYHAIEEREGVLATCLSRFIDTMAAFFESGFQTIDLNRWIEAGRPTLSKTFAITFDDGLSSILRVTEILQRYSFRATVFVVTDRFGKDNRWPGQPRWVPRWPLLNVRDLPTLIDAGLDIGSHTRNHPDLRMLNDEAVISELRGSKETIERLTNRPCHVFAYPYGSVNPRIRQIAANHFPISLCTTLDRVQPSDPADALPRIDAHYLRSTHVLSRLLRGELHGWLRRRRMMRCARHYLQMT